MLSLLTGCFGCKRNALGMSFWRHLKKQTIIKSTSSRFYLNCFFFLLFHALPQKIYIIPLHHRAHFLNIYLFCWLFLLLLFWNSHLVTSKLVHFFSTHNKTHEGTHKRMNQKKFKIRDTFFLGDSSQNVQWKKTTQTATRSFFCCWCCCFFYLFHLKCNLTRWFFCGCGSW